jgi:transcriptional regulator with XRE-family HTH domain
VDERAERLGRRACRDVGENAYRLRRRGGWTQKQLADRMDVSESEVRRFESGEDDMKISTLTRLADALGVKPGELLRHARRTAKRRPGRPKKSARRPGG